MNINDPFGRMQGKQQRDYESLCESLQRSGLDSPEAARLLQGKLGKRMKVGLAIIIPATLMLVLLFPDARIITLAVGGLLSVWIVNASRRGQQYVERYIHEELENKDP
ncbi:MAG: hypothetical protein ACJAWL_001319 [Motiliproteus sp.]|jgi:hypothetical protein